MSKKRIKIVVAIALTGVLLLAGVYYIKYRLNALNEWTVKQKQRYEANAKNILQVKVGMSENEVLAIMGEPGLVIHDTASTNNTYTQYGYGIEFIAIGEVKDVRILFDSSMHVVIIKMPPRG